jgi:hypothetical protein
VPEPHGSSTSKATAACPCEGSFCYDAAATITVNIWDGFRIAI